MRRLVAVLLAIATVLSCTTESINAAEHPQRDSSATMGPREYAVVSPTLHLTAPLRLIDTPAGHSAFPGLALHLDRSITLAWRQGADHVASRDGAVLTATSTDAGIGYHDPTTVLDDNADYRDPSPAVVNNELWLTYFTGTNAAPAGGAYVTRGGRAPVRIDQLPYAAIAAPVVQLPDGSVGAVYYGQAAGQVRDSVWFARSTNSGTTWSSTPVPVADGQVDGREYQEPWLVVRDGTLHVLFRYGNWDAVGISSSADGGATWSAPRKVITQATGRPTTIAYASGTMVVIYRHTLTRAAMIAVSRNGGVSFGYGGVLLTPPTGSPLGMTYAAGVEVVPGVAHVVVGAENADGSSRLYRGWLAEAAR